LWRWSTTELEAFWAALWEFSSIIAHSRYERVLDPRVMPGARWFSGATLNYAEHVLAKTQRQLSAGPRTALIASDASVPYRTTARAVAAYDGDHVARTLEEDLRTQGAPLVYRMDRASCHRVPQVRGETT
jgi:hypothetical protein